MIITYSKPSTFQPRNLRGKKYRSLQKIPYTTPPMVADQKRTRNPRIDGFSGNSKN